MEKKFQKGKFRAVPSSVIVEDKNASNLWKRWKENFITKSEIERKNMSFDWWFISSVESNFCYFSSAKAF